MVNNPPQRRAGVPLSELGGLPPIKGQPAAPAAPLKAVDNSDNSQAGLNSDLAQIIHPSVRDRWMTGVLANYTPTLIENTIRGAAAGNLMSVWLMFDLMERTWPRLSKNLNELKTAVMNLGWNVQPFALKGDKPTPEAQRRKRIIEQMLWTMRPDMEKDENDFEDTLYSVMDAVGKGVALVQVDYELRPVNASMDPKTVQMQQLWGPRATQWIHPRYYGYPSGNTNADDKLMLNVREILQNNPNSTLTATNGTWAEVPREQFIVSIFKQKSGHPLNSSLLAILGYWWAAQTFTWDWFLNFTQIFGMPIRWATYAPGAQNQTITQIMDMLQQMGTMAYGAFPQGTNLDLKTGTNDARNVPHKVMIDAADTICDILILGQTLTTTQGERGSQSLGTIHNEIRQEKVMGVAKRVAKILNVQLLPAICRLNFGNDLECPRLVPVDRSGKDAKAVADRYKVLLTTPGVKVARSQFYEENDLVIPDDDDEILTATSGTATNPAGDGGDNGDSPAELDAAQAKGRRAQAKGHRHEAVTDTLVDHALADATGIAPRWLGAVRPIFEELMAKAADAKVTDADFIAAIEAAQAKLPDVFNHMDHQALARVIEQTMSAGIVNGAVNGAMDRRKAVAA